MTGQAVFFSPLGTSPPTERLQPRVSPTGRELAESQGWRHDGIGGSARRGSRTRNYLTETHFLPANSAQLLIDCATRASVPHGLDFADGASSSDLPRSTQGVPALS